MSRSDLNQLSMIPSMVDRSVNVLELSLERDQHLVCQCKMTQGYRASGIHFFFFLPPQAAKKEKIKLTENVSAKQLNLQNMYCNILKLGCIFHNLKKQKKQKKTHVRYNIQSRVTSMTFCNKPKVLSSWRVSENGDHKQIHLNKEQFVMNKLVP